MATRMPTLAAALLLLTAASAWPQAQGAGAEAPELTAGDVVLAAASPHAPATLAAQSPVPAQPSAAEFSAFSDVFQHPMSPHQQESRVLALEAHTHMRGWLANFFRSPASSLTSVRLRAAQQVAEQQQAAVQKAAGEAAGEAAAVGEAAAAEEGASPAVAGAASSEAAEAAATEAEAAEVPGVTATEAAREDAEPAVAAGAAPAGDQLAPTPKEEAVPVDDGFLPVHADPQAATNCSASCHRAAAQQVLLEHEAPGKLVRLRWPAFAEDARRWAAPAGQLPGSCLPRQPGEVNIKEYLVVVAAGDDLTNVHRWLDQPESATFDVVVLHYGDASSPPSCPHCAAILSMPGPKWHLLFKATRLPIWRQLMAGKRAVMAADDDLEMDTCALNRAFEVFSAYGLLLGQPSLCHTEHRPSWYLHLVQDQAAIMRYVTMVEIMAPIFEAEFFQNFARHSLHDAYTGWGLDFVWPFLLQYPRDRIGVVDDACMTHPHSAQGKTGAGSVYEALARVAPFDAREEEARRDGQYMYYPSEVRALGFDYRPIEVVGMVPQPYRPPPLPVREVAPRAESLLLMGESDEGASVEWTAAAAAAQQINEQQAATSLQHPVEPAPVGAQQAEQPAPQQAAATVLQQQAAGSLPAGSHRLPPAQSVEYALLGRARRAAASRTASQHRLTAAFRGAADPGAVLSKPAALRSSAAAVDLDSQEGAVPARQLSPPSAEAALIWTSQHWLLFVQLSLMLGATTVLLLYSKQRRPGSPRSLRLYKPLAHLG